MRAVLLAGLLGLAACGPIGQRAASPPRDATPKSGWVMVEGIPFVPQPTRTACGEAALSMLLAYWHRPADFGAVKAECGLTPGGDDRVRAGTLRDVARAHGLRAFLLAGTAEDLAGQLKEGHPVLVGVVKRTGLKKGISHYELVTGLNPAEGRILLADPALGYREEPLDRFFEEWKQAGNLALIVLGPTPAGA